MRCGTPSGAGTRFGNHRAAISVHLTSHISRLTSRRPNAAPGMRRCGAWCSTITAGGRPVAVFSSPLDRPALRRRRMREASLDFLRALVETGGPSGYEQPVQQLFRRYVREYADEVQTDVLGNAIAITNSGGG